MTIDSQGAWITKAVKAGPGEAAKVCGEGLMELSSKIFQIFEGTNQIQRGVIASGVLTLRPRSCVM